MAANLRVALLVFLLHPAGSVIVYVALPKLVVSGCSALLTCQFDLEGEQLYSVKWYTRNEEFFRFSPQSSPSVRIFPTPGINVDLSGSNMNNVRLQNVKTNVSGEFLCEVSADGPTFNAGSDSAYLKVSDITIRKPQLLISSSVYRPDMYINCSAQFTDPPPKITFFLDDSPVEKKWVTGGVEGVWSMNVEAVMRHVKERLEVDMIPVLVRCEARLEPQVYHLSSASIPILVQHHQTTDLPVGAGLRSGWSWWLTLCSLLIL